MGAAMRDDLTPRQQEVLQFIQAYIQTRKVPPTVREIGAPFGISSKAVFDHLTALERKGRLRRAARGSRMIELVPAGKRADERAPAGLAVPVVGRIAAGLPLLAEERIEDYLTVDPRLLSRGQLFALHVSGQSMIGAGILDGDYVIARQQHTADSGDIVVALIENEATVKRLRRRGKTWQLEPENPAYAAIPITEPLTVQGKVIAVYRHLA
jgi:repressor LexA